MPNDYIALAITSVILIGGGLFLLFQVKNDRNQHAHNKEQRDDVKHA